MFHHTGEAATDEDGMTLRDAATQFDGQIRE
jgi:hypothetical protein